MLPLKSDAQQSNYSLKTYSTKDGMSGEYVLNLFQDSCGFIWIGTNNGLSRFDGKNFRNYGFQEGLNFPRVHRIFEDRDHRLWVATANKIFELKGDHFYPYSFSDSADEVMYIHTIWQLKNAELWAQTRKNAYRFNGRYWQKSNLLPGYDIPCVGLVETKNGTYYNYREVIVKKENDGTIKELWRKQPAGKIHFGEMYYRDNHLYVATKDGISMLSDNGDTAPIFKGVLDMGSWTNFIIDAKNRFWVCRTGIKMIYVSAPGDTEKFVDSIPTSESLFSGFFEDKDHTIWVASVKGLTKIQEQQQLHFNSKNNPLVDDIRNIAETADGKLLAFSRENGILQFNGSNFIKAPWQFYDYPAANIDFIDTYFRDEKKRTWFETRNGQIFRIEEKGFTNCNYLLPDRTMVWADYNSLTKKIFLALDTLRFADEHYSSIFISHNLNKIIQFPKYIKCFKNGKTLVVCENAEIILIDEQNNAVNVNKQLGLGNANAGAHFLDDNKNGFWMYGGSYGLKHFQWNKKWMENDLDVDQRIDLDDATINAACIDYMGRIWAVTNRGVIVIKIDSANGNKILVKQLSDNSDISVTTPANTKLLTASDGRIWYTDVNDIYSFDPGKIVFNAKAPQINIENININFKKTNWKNYTDSFQGYERLPINPLMKYNENNLQINYIGISFTSSADLLYSYRLKGLDTTWSNSSINNFVIYANLASGKYEFNVRARTPNSDWCEPAIFYFTIKPAFWNSWWFRLLIICLASSMIISIYRNRIKKIRQEIFIKHQLTELEMTALKAQMNPHFIYNALNSIQALVTSDKKDEAVYYIGTFSRLLRQVLNQSENNVISLEKELHTLELYVGLESLRLNMKPTYEVHIEKGILTDDEKIPPLILQPFIENALWHGLSKKEGEKKITINITADKNWLTCTITDNGIGRKKSADLKKSTINQHNSKGIDITAKRLNDFNNDKNLPPIRIEDMHDEAGKPTGTKIILHIRRIN
ncbi:MAG: histidine kinase [Ferruginibacter sp.]